MSGDLSPKEAIDLGVLALNTILHPDATTDELFAQLDGCGERAIDKLIEMREGVVGGGGLPAAVDAARIAEVIDGALEEAAQAVEGQKDVYEGAHDNDYTRGRDNGLYLAARTIRARKANPAALDGEGEK